MYYIDLKSENAPGIDVISYLVESHTSYTGHTKNPVGYTH